MFNFKTKLFAILMTMAIVFSASITSVSAFTYTAVNGTYTTFDKYLIMDVDANVPDITFNYSISAGTAKTYTAGSKVAVYAGNDSSRVSGTPTIASVNSGAGAANADFNPGDTTYTTTQTGDQVTLDTNEKYAKKTVGVNFANVSFKEPGIYRYIITETSADQQAVTYDTQAGTAGQKTRVLDVYVTDNNGSLVVSGYILHETEDDVNASDTYGSNGTQVKSKGFVNEYTTYDLTFAKNVSGNQASKDQYFKFTVSITNAGANSWFDVVLTNASAAVPETQANAPSTLAAYLGESNSADLTSGRVVCDSTGAKTAVFYLQHGQSIQIKGLPEGAKYTITEVAEDYKPNVVVTSGDSVGVDTSAKNVITDTTSGITADTVDTFTNTKGGIVPTGVSVAIGGGIFLTAIGISGFALTKKRNRKEED